MGTCSPSKIFMVFTASRFPYLIIYPNLMTIQKEGCSLFIKLEQLEHSNMERATAMMG